MKKVERINTIMRYINNRSYFTISEIMREFNISRSTAIRDIREIEAIGLPLAAEVGRDGGYSVLSNSVLPSIRFNDNEIKALFISFMATRNQQLPYLKSRQSLAEKLLGLIPENQQETLMILNETLLFEGTIRNHPDLLDLTDLPHPMLEKLIQFILTDRHLLISVKENNMINCYPVYILHLYREKSRWQIETFDLNIEQHKVFPVDYLTDVKLYPSEKRTNKKEILKKLSRLEERHNLIIELGQTAIAQYKKYHPLKFSLAYTHPYQAEAVMKTFINIHDEEELDETINWLLFLGKDIKLLKVPEEIIKSLKMRINLYS